MSHMKKHTNKNSLFDKYTKTFIIMIVVVGLFSVTVCGDFVGLGQNKGSPVTLQYSFKFTEPSISLVTLQKQPFSSLSIPGTISMGCSVGAPRLPAKPVKILLPQGTILTDVSISCSSKEILDLVSKGIDIQEFPIVPHQKQIILGSPPPSTFEFNQQKYTSEIALPGKLYDDVSIGYCKGYAIVSFTLFPVEYIPSIGEVSYYPEMTIFLNLHDSVEPNQYFRGSPDDEQWVQSLVMNPAIASTYTVSQQKDEKYSGGLCSVSDNNGEGYGYVIITTDELYDFSETYTWDDLIDKKEADGLHATKVTVEDIILCSDYWNATSLFNDTAALIREFCKDAYQDWNTQYILIGGDDDGSNKIERREMDSAAESAVETDIYWTHLDSSFNEDQDTDWGEEGDDGFDLYSEMCSGSIPCDEGIDVSNWLTKSFFYEESNEINYLDNAAFYGGDTTWDAEGDEIIEFSAIFGTDDWMGPNPYGDGPYPSWLGFQWGFETWNANYPALSYNLSVKWTGEPPNPGWSGGSTSAAINGLKNAINNDQVTLISSVAHANSGMSMDVYSSNWESEYHNTKPFFLTDQGCHCGDMDASDDGVLHSMLFHDDTELAFAVVYNTGYGWGNYDGTNASSAIQQKGFWDYLFDIANNSQSVENWQLGKAHEWSRDLLAPAIDWICDGDDGAVRNTIQGCLLFGDPAQRLKVPFVPEHDIDVSNLNIPSFIPHGETQTVTTLVKNMGNNLETNLLVNFTVDGTVIDSIIIDSLDSFDSITVSFSWNPDYGTYLVGIDVAFVPNEYDYTNNQVNRTVQVIAAPAIDVAPSTLSFLVPMGSSDSDILTIANLGYAETSLAYSIVCNDGIYQWLSASPATGAVAVGEFDDITVTIDTSGLEQRDYEGSIVISSNDLDDPEVVVPVYLTVVYGNDMKAVSLNYPTGVIPTGSYIIDATVQNLGSYPQTGVIVNCSIFEGGIGGVVLDEDFSTNPTDWTITHVSGTAWTWDSYDQRMEHTYGYPNAGYLDSPILDCSGKTGISLSFWHYWKADYSSEQQDGYVRGSIDGGVTFPYLIDEFHHNDPGEETAVKYYDISAWANGQSDVMIRFDIYNYNDWYWRIDDFNVSAEITGPLVYYAETLIDIGQYASQNVQFSPAWNPGMGVYGVQITTLLPTDENPSNDVVADVVSVEGPGLAYTPNSYDFGTMLVGTTGATNFNIWNDGVGTLSYALSESASWVTLSTYSGTSSGEHDPITVTVDTTGLTSGVLYQCDISITSDGGSGVFHVDVLVVDSTTPMLDVEQTLYDRGFPIRHATDGDWAGAQSFTPTMSAISGAEVYLRKFGTPEFDLTIELRKDSPTGTLYDTITIPTSEVGTSYSWLWCDFADTPVTAGTKYFVVIPPAPSGVTTSYGYEWAYAFGNQYDGGAFWFTRNGGGLWRDLGTMYEYAFKTYGLL